jgi:hypothetical protein
LRGVLVSGEDAPRPCLENLIVLEIKTNKNNKALAPNQSRQNAAQVTAHHHSFSTKLV